MGIAIVSGLCHCFEKYHNVSDDSFDHMACVMLLCCVQELRNDAELQEGNLGWLKARMAVLMEISADSEAQRQGSALSKLSTDFKGLLASLSEVGE